MRNILVCIQVHSYTYIHRKTINQIVYEFVAISMTLRKPNIRGPKHTYIYKDISKYYNQIYILIHYRTKLSKSFTFLILADLYLSFAPARYLTRSWATRVTSCDTVNCCAKSAAFLVIFSSISSYAGLVTSAVIARRLLRLAWIGI